MNQDEIERGRAHDAAGLAAMRSLIAGQKLIEKALEPHHPAWLPGEKVPQVQQPHPAKVVTAIHGETLRRLVVAAEDVLERTEERDYGREHGRLQDAVDDVKRELRGE